MSRGRPRSEFPAVGPAIAGARIDRMTEVAAEDGSRRLLAAILRYGIRHDRDFGMGAATFAARCEDAGVPVPVALIRAS